MCKSFEISMIAGTVSYAIALYMWFRNYKNDRWHAIFLFVVSSIQFMEAILWNARNNGTANSALVKVVIALFIPLILSLEPIAALFGSAAVGKQIDTCDKVIYITICVGMFMAFTTHNSFPDVFSDGTIHFQNEFSPRKNMWMYWIFYFLLVYPFLKYGGVTKFYVIMAIVVALALLMATNQISIGSSWCLYANITSLFILFYPYID
jgi:hypothetical protein